MTRPFAAAHSVAPTLLAVAALALLAAVSLLALSFGKYHVPLTSIVGAVTARLTGVAKFDADPVIETIVFQVRLPRIVAGLLVGAALAAAGTAYQAMFRNPLVSPDILGVSAGASLGAVAGIFFSLPLIAIQGLAFGGGLLAVFIVSAIGMLINRQEQILVLVLAGIAVGASLGALLSLLKILADPYDQLPAITFWLLGSLNATAWLDVETILFPVVMGLAALLAIRWRLNLLTLSDEEALALGANPKRLRLIAIVAATLITAAAVSVSGIIGWLGLIVPHLARLITGPDLSKLLPAAMVLGAAFLVLADLAARTMAAIEIPLGIVTAALGAPALLALLAASQRDVA